MAGYPKKGGWWSEVLSHQFFAMNNSHILYYEDGEVIFEEGSIGQEFYIIESGKVEISQRIDSGKTLIAVLGNGDFFGEMAALTDAPRSATAKAIGKTTLMPISMEEVFRRMQTNPQFTASLLQTLVNRLRSTTSTLRTLIARMYTLGYSFMEGVTPEKHPLKINDSRVAEYEEKEGNRIFNTLSSDAEGDKRISKKSYESLQEMVSCLKEQVHQKDKQIETLQKQLKEASL